MSHGHSHSHGGHGHSHGGGGGVQNFVTSQLGMDDDYEDDPAFDQQNRGRKANSVVAESTDLTSAFENLCASGYLSAVMLKWCQGYDVETRTGFQNVDATPVMWACLKGQLPVVRFLHERGADLNAATPDGQTALMWAATEARIEVGYFLLKNGVKADAVDQRNYTAAMVAVQNDDLAFLHMVHHNAGCDPAHLDFDGHTYAIWAAYRGQLSVLEYCVDVIGCDVTHKDKTKRTAMHWAAREGHSEVLAWLIARGLNPDDRDSDGFSSIEWAQSRKHREATEVLKMRLAEIPNRRAGTLSKIASDRVFLMLALGGVIVPVLGYFWTLFTPPILANFIIGAFTSKNVIMRMAFPRPETSAKSALSLASELGAPKTVAQAFRGMATTRMRDPMNLLGFMTLLCIQHMAFRMVDMALPPLYWVQVAVLVLFFVLAKNGNAKQIIPRGTLKDSPILSNVERKEFEMLHERAVDASKHVRLPLRAFYCVEVDANVRRYDGWSQLLDAPVGQANHRFFFLFITTFVLLQASTFVWAFSQFSATVCSHHTESWTFLRGSYSLLVHGLPCNDIAEDVSKMTWLQWLLPTVNNTAGVWLLQFSLAMGCLLFAVFARQVVGITQGTTRMEMKNPVAPTTNGQMVSIFRGKEQKCIYSEGPSMANMILFILGKQGERWNDLYAVPAPPNSSS